MKQEYSLTLLAMQLAVQERVQDLVFPWLLDHHDWNGRVVIPSGVVLSFAKIDQKLKDLLFDSDDAEWEIADPTKVIMIVNALTDDQRMKLVNSLRSKLPGLGGQLDLRQIDYATLKKELEWFASFDWDAEIKARQRQSGGRERAFRGQQRWGEARGGGMKWVVKKPVVDSRCSRHFFSSLRDVKSCVVEVRETDSEFVGVEGDVARAESDVTMDLPGVEYVDGAEEGWEEIIESIFVLKDEEKKVKAVMAVHVDDLLIFSADPACDFEPLRQRLKMDEQEILSVGGEMGYTGLEVRKNESGFEMSQEVYLKSIPVQTDDLPRKSFSPEMLNKEKEEEKEEDLVAVMMKVMGVLG
uniref:Reverse transcriptase Ty1/copia-type domain-containing protein n=1 Tax=Chromera velia CCMP2878 TaxID=1169474 RepID=A0A0K6S6T5_9ALVE|eukprot:Cvel_3832.t1-p1 / transcript=Cvel_3832.t1 / gene=Cvel_3832 / organism=Chromera_velia_CCMP2878 / gene_product=hypothetical protein / transcript_product=hypothetical protein / location=Cvel_scaffold162:21110-25202(+) / protein_length=354 / sequence_SO=supercontig / SO=protein_coding / is_pseudo=false